MDGGSDLLVWVCGLVDFLVIEVERIIVELGLGLIFKSKFFNNMVLLVMFFILKDL